MQFFFNELKSNFFFNSFILPSHSRIGCDKIIGAVTKITASDLLCYCVLPPWPNVKIRLDVLTKFLLRHKIANSRRILSNKKKNANLFQRKALIEMNSFCWTNSLHIEMINLNPIGPVGDKYREVADSFAKCREFDYLALHSYEVKVSDTSQYILKIFILIS